MDRETFDALARLLATTPSRRAALGTLIGAGLASAASLADARNKKTRNRKRTKKRDRRQASDRAAVSAEAVQCEPPRRSANLSGCNYNNRDLSGADLSSSRMVGTRFRGANLCGADLSSSQLKDADFRGFPATGVNAGNPTNLTLADLHSSGCAGMLTNNRTIFCRTIGCDGDVINPECPGACGCVPTSCAALGKECGTIPNSCGGPPLNCGQCSAPEVCCSGPPTNTCPTSGTCNACPDTCPPECNVCFHLVDGGTACAGGILSPCAPCTSDAGCSGEERCILAATFTFLEPGSQTVTASELCGQPREAGACVQPTPCDNPE